MEEYTLSELDDILYELEFYADENNLEGFNFTLDELYDWADDNRVWLGL